MEFSPSKRRKISPTTSVPHDALNQPNLGVEDDDVRTTPSRASYLSPTKASLACFNPNLLPRPERKRDEGQNASGQVNGTKVNGVEEVGTNNNRTTHRINVGQDEDMPEGSTSTSRALAVLNGHISLTAPPRTRSRTPATGVHTETRPPPDNRDVRASPPEAARAASGTVHNTVGKQLEIELPESVADREDPAAKVANQMRTPAIARNLQEDEPQLPPTPDYLLLQAEQRPPKGLLFSSPIRRQKRKCKKGSDAGSSIVSSSSSPLKLRDTQRPKGVVEKPASLRLQSHVPDADSTLAIHVAGVEKDPDIIQKRQEVERLRVQLQAIQRDLIQLETTATQLPDLPLIEQEPKQANEELLRILLSDNPTHLPSVASPMKLSITDRLSRFLPFSKRPVPLVPPQLPILSPSPLKPLDLPNPVPYLNLFSPLSFTCTPARILPCSVSEPLLRCQSVTLASAHYILIVKLEVTTEVSTQNITELTIRETSSFAEPELGSWIRARAAERDLTGIAWAVGRYWDKAVIRARCWTICEKNFGQLLPFAGGNSTRNLAHSEKDARSAGKKALQRREHIHRDFRNNVSDLEGPSDSEEPISKAQLHFHIGRQSIIFTRRNLSLLVTWRISFDWIGEAQSELSASVRYPESWTQIDEMGSLQHMGRVFDILLKSKGVSQAIRTLVELLFSD